MPSDLEVDLSGVTRRGRVVPDVVGHGRTVVKVPRGLPAFLFYLAGGGAGAGHDPEV